MLSPSTTSIDFSATGNAAYGSKRVPVESHAPGVAASPMSTNPPANIQASSRARSLMAALRVGRGWRLCVDGTVWTSLSGLPSHPVAVYVRAMAGSVRVYIACSLDGFIATQDDDLDWLTNRPTPSDPLPPDPRAVSFEAFLGDVGVMLMGRRTYDVVSSFGDEHWAYGDLPVRVLTRRALQSTRPSVAAVSGDLASVVADALETAAGKDVYVDGGQLIRQALDAGLVDELIVTWIPVVLGEGRSLFAGTTKRHEMEFAEHLSFPGGFVQTRLRPVRAGSA